MTEPTFSVSRLSFLLAYGGVYAIAGIRFGQYPHVYLPHASLHAFHQENMDQEMRIIGADQDLHTGVVASMAMTGGRTGIC